MARLYFQHRCGFTLVEMMIAMIITLMIVFAMVEAFRWVGETTTEGRAVIEMNGQIRHARFQLEEDLARATVRTLEPWRYGPDQYPGYFELIEGTGRDNRVDTSNAAVPLAVRFIDRADVSGYDSAVFDDTVNPLSSQWGSLFGDVDDVLAFTVRNDEKPFTGRYGSVIIESSYAEIIWWAELNDQERGTAGEWDPGETFTIRRRVLLIRPDLNDATTKYLQALPNNTTVEQQIATYLESNDISVRAHFDSSNNLVGIAANSLGDLASRHNRTAHTPVDLSIQDANGVPRGLSAGDVQQSPYMSRLDASRLPGFSLGNYFGEDVVLTNVTAFDFRVWDPNAPVCQYATGGGELAEGLVPGDVGYDAAVSTGNVVGLGAYVDLGAMFTGGSLTSAQTVVATYAPHFLSSHVRPAMQLRSRLNRYAGTATDGLPLDENFVYDPWTAHYEKDGYNQDATDPRPTTTPPYAQETPLLVDEGNNGLDDNGSNGVDDNDERETSPPYPYPLQAIQVRIRMYEPDTRQVKQASQVIRFSK